VPVATERGDNPQDSAVFKVSCDAKSISECMGYQKLLNINRMLDSTIAGAVKG